MSHTMPWKNAKSINEFTNLVVTNDGRTQVLELFRKHGYVFAAFVSLKIFRYKFTISTVEESQCS